MTCNCPKGEELYAIIKENIENYGFHIMYVFDHDDPTKTFFYTIGLHEQGLPELFMGVNCNPQTGASVIHNVVRDMKENGLKYKRNSDIIEGMDIKLVPLNKDKAIDTHMVQIEGYYGHRVISAAQIVMPDINGKLPDEEGYEMPQVILKRIELH